MSLTGTVAWQDHVAVRTRWLPGGGAVQDAGEWWTIIADAVRRRWPTATCRADRVVAVCVTGQWASTVPVDDDGVPVGDCIMWKDHRGIRLARQRIGGPVAGYDPRALATWIRQTAGIPGGQRPDRSHAPPRRRTTPTWPPRLAGTSSRSTTWRCGSPASAAASHASMTAAWLTDNRRLDVLGYDDDLVRRAGIDGTKLPPLVATGSVIGPVRDDVAADLGLPPGVQVVTGVPDLHAAAIGSGALGPGEAHMALSTTSWISLPVPRKKTDILHGMASIPGLDGGYVLANNHDTSGVCLQWLRDNLVTPSDGLFGDGHPAADPCTFDDLTALAAGSPPGARRTIFTPWLDGERTPVADSHARGGFHNLSLATTRADLVRAVMEGVAYNNQWLLGHVERFVKQRLDPIRIVGGGAASELWCQIHADVMDRTIEQVDDPLNAQLRGAAVLAGMSLGLVDKGEVRELVGVSRTFTPEPGNRQVYDRLSSEVPKLYSSQRKMFRRLNRRWS